jgi:hypothetical protein
MLGKAFFAECRGFAECFLFGSRQSLICRAPKKKRSAKPPALGKEADSGGASGHRVYVDFTHTQLNRWYYMGCFRRIRKTTV